MPPLVDVPGRFVARCNKLDEATFYISRLSSIWLPDHQNLTSPGAFHPQCIADGTSSFSSLAPMPHHGLIYVHAGSQLPTQEVN